MWRMTLFTEPLLSDTHTHTQSRTAIANNHKKRTIWPAQRDSVRADTVGLLCSLCDELFRCPLTVPCLSSGPEPLPMQIQRLLVLFSLVCSRDSLQLNRIHSIACIWGGGGDVGIVMSPIGLFWRLYVLAVTILAFCNQWTKVTTIGLEERRWVYGASSDLLNTR